MRRRSGRRRRRIHKLRNSPPSPPPCQFFHPRASLLLFPHRLCVSVCNTIMCVCCCGRVWNSVACLGLPCFVMQWKGGTKKAITTGEREGEGGEAPICSVLAANFAEKREIRSNFGSPSLPATITPTSDCWNFPLPRNPWWVFHARKHSSRKQSDTPPHLFRGHTKARRPKKAPLEN